MTEQQDKINSQSRVIADRHLKFHHRTIVVLYAVAVFMSYKILSLPEAQKDLVSLLSTGAILATFGSAIGAIGLIWQDDFLARVKLNIDILYSDIIKQETPWRRWPFLARSSREKLLSGNSVQQEVSNPEIRLDVGTHIIKIDLPTVLEDFFDLPLIKNYWQLCRYRKAAYTVYGRKNGDAINVDTGLTPSDGHMAYECMFDIWKSIFIFRFARYIVHFGSGLTICGALIVAVDVMLRS
jgi:hypothetical protein